LPDGDADAARRLVSYELVLHLVRASLELGGRHEVARFQFKLHLTGWHGEAGEDLLISEVHGF
jgi:hypothetical protein